MQAIRGEEQSYISYVDTGTPITVNFDAYVRRRKTDVPSAATTGARSRSEVSGAWTGMRTVGSHT